MGQTWAPQLSWKNPSQLRACRPIIHIPKTPRIGWRFPATECPQKSISHLSQNVTLKKTSTMCNQKNIFIIIIIIIPSHTPKKNTIMSFTQRLADVLHNSSASPPHCRCHQPPRSNPQRRRPGWPWRRPSSRRPETRPRPLRHHGRCRSSWCPSPDEMIFEPPRTKRLVSQEMIASVNPATQPSWGQVKLECVFIYIYTVYV